MAGKRTKKTVAEDSRYHDTWRLLKKYRDVVWSMELSVQQVKKEFEIEYGRTIEDFLESAYLAGADLGGTKFENYARCIERSNQMLKLLDNAVNILRTRHKSGETYYWLLYHIPFLPFSRLFIGIWKFRPQSPENEGIPLVETAEKLEFNFLKY